MYRGLWTALHTCGPLEAPNFKVCLISQDELMEHAQQPCGVVGQMSSRRQLKLKSIASLHAGRTTGHLKVELCLYSQRI